MGSKTICIKESIYNRLSKYKGANESYSDVLKRLMDKLDQVRNNRDLILKEIYDSPEEIISDEFIQVVKDIHEEINENFTITVKDLNTK